MGGLTRANLLRGAEGIVGGWLDEDLPGAGLKIEEVKLSLAVGDVLEADWLHSPAAIHGDQDPRHGDAGAPLQ